MRLVIPTRYLFERVSGSRRKPQKGLLGANFLLKEKSQDGGIKDKS